MKKIILNLNDYRDRKFCMHCPEEWQAEVFCEFLHRAGRKWVTDKLYIECLNWRLYGRYTVYFFNEGTYGDLEYAEEFGYTVLEISDFIFNENQNKEREINMNIFKCPVCEGRGIVPSNFYSYYNYSVVNTTVQCRSCAGKGYIIAEERNITSKGVSPCLFCNQGWESITTAGQSSCRDTCKAFKEYKGGDIL